MNIDVLTSPDAVATLEAEWDELLDATPCNRAFSSSAWYRAAIEGTDGSPLVVTARRDRHLIALLPLLDAGFATRLADYNDVLLRGPQELARAVLEAALDVHETLHLRELREDSALSAALDERFRIEHEPARPVLFTPLDGGYDAWLAARSRAFRKSLFRAERAAAARGLVVRELDSIDGELFLALHDVRSRPSVFAIEENRAFIRRALPPLVQQKRLRAFALFDDDRVVAIDLCAGGADSLCTWNTGYLREYAAFSPGTLLLAHEIRTACAAGLAEFDLGRGDEHYKKSWAGRTRALARIRVSR